MSNSTLLRAPFWKRAVATAIDTFFLSLTLGLVSTLYRIGKPSGTESALFVFPWVLLVACVFIFYEPILLYTRGATLGKMIMHIWVFPRNGRHLTLAMIIKRSLGKILSSIVNFGYLLALIDPERRTLHDRLSGTIVIAVDAQNLPIHKPTPRPSFGSYWVFTLLLLLSIFSTGFRIASMRTKWLYLPVLVKTSAMSPTFAPDSFVMVRPIEYLFTQPKRGDIVWMKAPSGTYCENRKDCQLVRRIVAVPGDTIAIESGRVFLNGVEIEEKYLSDSGTLPGPFLRQSEPYAVPRGHYIVLADNRSDLADSRVFGPVSRYQVQAKIIRVADVTFYPTLRGEQRDKIPSAE